LRSGHPPSRDENGNLITNSNGLLEVGRKNGVVEKPIYGLPKLDVKVVWKYQFLGFEFRALEVSEIHVHGGILPCVTAVLAQRQCVSPVRRSRL
jgi:hypothetical protein